MKYIFFHFYYFNMDISVTTKVSELKFSVFDLNILLDRSVSQNSDLGLSYHFMAKNG